MKINFGEIKISCGSASIIRNIRDICIWNDLMIITWYPEQTKLKNKGGEN